MTMTVRSGRSRWMLAQQREAVHPGHAHVGEDEVGVARLELAERVLPLAATARASQPWSARITERRWRIDGSSSTTRIERNTGRERSSDPRTGGRPARPIRARVTGAGPQAEREHRAAARRRSRR